MAVSDILKDVGKGLATAGRVAAPVLERTAQVVSGQAPQIDAENRKQQYEMEDKQIAAKASILENQLATGQKYGTLTPEQQQQYVDQITGLYSHPRHAGTLMEKLRKAIHPNGAVAHAPSAPLANPVPEGGTAKTDEETRQNALADALGMRQAATDEEIDRRAKDAQKYHKPAGKSPPTPGNQLPPDAIGPDGQPIPTTDRNAGKSFMEWNGAWYGAPKAKPVYKIIKGNVVLMDPATGLPQRNLGPSTGVKVTSHQTPFLGDDQQMHLLTTTSVTTPQGESIEVEGPPPEAPEDKEKAQNTPAKKVNPGSILPKTGAKPAASPGPVIPGSHALAQSKDPLFKAEIGSVKKANDDVIAATKLSSLADQVAANPHDAVNQKRLAVALERQASGRFTTQALNYVIKAGWGNTLEQWANNPTTGALPSDVMRQLVDGAHQNLKASQEALKTAQGSLGGQPESGGAVENWVRGPDGKLVKQ